MRMGRLNGWGGRSAGERWGVGAAGRIARVGEHGEGCAVGVRGVRRTCGRNEPMKRRANSQQVLAPGELYTGRTRYGRNYQQRWNL